VSYVQKPIQVFESRAAPGTVRRGYVTARYRNSNKTIYVYSGLGTIRAAVVHLCDKLGRLTKYDNNIVQTWRGENSRKSDYIPLKMAGEMTNIIQSHPSTPKALLPVCRKHALVCENIDHPTSVIEPTRPRPYF